MHTSEVINLLESSADISQRIEGTELTVEPIKYRLDLFVDGEIDRFTTRYTWGGWSIEGDFLCTWSANGMKQAEKLPSKASRIETVEMPTEESKIAKEEEDNKDEAHS